MRSTCGQQEPVEGGPVPALGAPLSTGRPYWDFLAVVTGVRSRSRSTFPLMPSTDPLLLYCQSAKFRPIVGWDSYSAYQNP